MIAESRGWLVVPSGHLAVSTVAPVDFGGTNAATTLRRGVLMLPGTGLRNGPQDLFVLFSRQCASWGLACLRVDYSFYGDSWPACDQAMQISTLRAEARAALDTFQADFALDELILLGLCTGGEIALSLAQEMPNVVACVLWSTAAVYSPLTPAKRARHAFTMLRMYGRKLFYLATWRKLLRGGVDGAMVRRTLTKRQVAPDSEKQSALGISKRRSGARRVPMLFVYGERDPDRRQAVQYYRRLFPDTAAITTVPKADHNFSSVAWATQATKLTKEWLSRQGLLGRLQQETDHAEGRYGLLSK